LFKKIHVFRVMPQQELLAEITAYCKNHQITSGVIFGIIGSVTKARLNFLLKLPGDYKSVEYIGPMEIACAHGTVALKDNNLILHIHAQLSSQDISRGGHVAEATVFSTAEVTIGELDYQLERFLDKNTGLNELVK
jgi:predicted DNA-binding protein with PD1-like motif